MFNPSTTVCAGCVFAVLEEGSQVGCEAEQVKKFKDQGVKVEVVNKEGKEPQEGENTHYKIHRLCMMLRAPAWAEDKTGNLVTLARLENTIHPVAIVPVETQKDFDNLSSTFEGLNKQDTPFKSVVVLASAVDFPSSKMVFKTKNLAEQHKLNWQVELGPKAKKLTTEQIMDNAVRKLKVPFITVVEPGKDPLPRDFVSYIDRSVNDDLATLLYIEPEENHKWHGFTCYTIMYNKMLGNESIVEANEETGDKTVLPANIVDKIKHFGGVKKQCG